MRISVALPDAPRPLPTATPLPRRPSANGTCACDDELAFWLAGTEERRAQAAHRIATLAANLDWERFCARLDARGLAGLIGTRLLAAPGVEAPESFERTVERIVEQERFRSLFVEAESIRLWRILEDAGIRAVVVKGPFMAQRLYGDPGLRRSGDVDLLVQPEEFQAAIRLLETQGYTTVKGRTWREGLPLFETTLQASESWRPPVDLHWRLHWNDVAFSRELLERAELPGDGPRRPAPLDELAMLLLIFSRDGLSGLRAVADIAAWCDGPGRDVEPGALEPVAAGHASVSDALVAALSVAERLGGVPVRRLLPSEPRLPRGARTATRLASWQGGSESENQAMVALVDLLLAPRGQRFGSVQRHLLPPPAVISRIYDVPEHAPIRRTLGRIRFAVLVGWRLLPRQARALWATRRGRELAPPPA